MYWAYNYVFYFLTVYTFYLKEVEPKYWKNLHFDTNFIPVSILKRSFFSYGKLLCVTEYSSNWEKTNTYNCHVFQFFLNNNTPKSLRIVFQIQWFTFDFKLKIIIVSATRRPKPKGTIDQLPPSVPGRLFTYLVLNEFVSFSLF